MELSTPSHAWKQAILHIDTCVNVCSYNQTCHACIEAYTVARTHISRHLCAQALAGARTQRHACMHGYTSGPFSQKRGAVKEPRNHTYTDTCTDGNKRLHVRSTEAHKKHVGFLAGAFTHIQRHRMGLLPEISKPGDGRETCCLCCFP